MAFEPRAACRVVRGDGRQDDIQAAALAEEPDRTLVSQGFCELADVCVRFARDPGAVRHLGVVWRVIHRHVPQASDTLTLERFSPGPPVRCTGRDSRTALGRKGEGKAAVDDAPSEYLALIRLVGATELLLSLAEQIDGEIVDEAILAELYELRERANAALRSLSER
jgi:hypothetical protein